MYKKLEETSGALFAFQLSGMVSKVETLIFIGDLEAVTKNRPQIDMMVVLKDFDGWDPDARKIHFKGMMNKARKVGKAAIVADAKWEKYITNVDTATTRLFGIEERFFHHHQFTEALDWLNSNQF